MKLENLNRARQLAEILKSLDTAIKDTTVIVNTRTKNSFGYESGNNNSIYSCHVSEFSDGSGDGVDLTNCGIAVEVFGFILSQLQTQREKIISEIATL